MEKPRLFISAVTRELGGARQRIANILHRNGCEPVFQEIFGTEPGDLRDMLREKIDSCAGLIQIAGDAYGAEPADPHPEFGRCSYTQFEFLYAFQQKKQSWLLLAGPGCKRDTRLKKLDLPRTPHPDPAAYQAERQELQRLYKQRPEFQHHLRHTAKNDLALDLAVERMRNLLKELREEDQRWQKEVTRLLIGNLRIGRTTIALTTTALLGISAVLYNQHTNELNRLKAEEEDRRRDALVNSKLDSVLKGKDQLSIEQFSRGERPSDISKEQAEQALARHRGITVEELRALLDAGTQSPSPMAQARALVLKGNFDAAIEKLPNIKTTQIADQIAVLTVEAQAYEGKFKYQEALAARQKIAALIDKEKDPGAWADAQHMVAYSLVDVGKVREVEPILKEVIALRERILGKEHSDTLASRNNLANTLWMQGKNVEAEAEHRALIIFEEQALGPENPDTLASRNNLANALQSQGKYAEAAAEFRALIILEEQALGPEDPKTLASRNNLANALQSQGRESEARDEHRAVLAILDRVLGPDHPDTLTSRHNYANAQRQTGKIEDVIKEHRAVFAARERILGKEHHQTIASRSSIAAALHIQGKNAEAEQEFRAVGALLQRVLGEEHPDTLSSRYNLAIVLQEQKKTQEADKEHRATLDLRLRTLGPDHPDTLASRNSLALSLGAQGKFAEEEAEHRAILAARERVLGQEHPATLRSRVNLGLSLTHLGDGQDARGAKDAARAYWREALEHARIAQAAGTRVFGKDHPYLPRFDQLVADLEAKLKE